MVDKLSVKEYEDPFRGGKGGNSLNKVKASVFRR
jgi:hypothetical protein